jgi:indolepyruvate ferredoxin oxidoreductase beta subunit
MSDSSVTNILVVGIGGQGVMTATEILAEGSHRHGPRRQENRSCRHGAARAAWCPSHLRFGKKVLSPQIMAGTADLLVGFESAESLRWCHYLKAGSLVLMNTSRLVPPVVDIGLYDYPDDPLAEIRARGYEVHAFDAMAIAMELGDIRLGNTVMLGAMADHLPFSADVLLESILKRFRARKPKMVEVNQKAFEAGRAADAAASHNKESALT